ncbi:MAG: hypothetical protein AAFV29_19870 [Myxococcota bacterium]
MRAGGGASDSAAACRADGEFFSTFEPNVFRVRNVGGQKVATFSINGNDGNPTQTPPGIVFDDGSVELGSPLQIGSVTGREFDDVTAEATIPALPPGTTGHFHQLDLTFAPGTFGRGDEITFGMDRDEADANGPLGSARGNSADVLADGVLIPEGTIINGGVEFFGQFENGKSFRGRLKNRIGRGYSPLDGFGFINAEDAVKRVRRRRRR